MPLFKRIRQLALWPLRLLKAVATWLFALVLIFEEWGWEPLARALAWIGSWPGFHWIESRIKQLPPYGAVALFAVPVLALLPIKLLALYWLSHGHQVLGIGMILAAKVGGTAITARLFMLTQSTLMKLAWFARWFTRWINWKNTLLQRVKQSQAWLTMKGIQKQLRTEIARGVQAIRKVFGDH